MALATQPQTVKKVNQVNRIPEIRVVICHPEARRCDMPKMYYIVDIDIYVKLNL